MVYPPKRESASTRTGITSERRPLGTQANALEQELRNIILMYLWGDARGIDPVERIQSPAFLKLSELNDLDRLP
jgi:hypothetical protein